MVAEFTLEAINVTAHRPQVVLLDFDPVEPAHGGVPGMLKHRDFVPEVILQRGIGNFTDAQDNVQRRGPLDEGTSFDISCGDE